MLPARAQATSWAGQKQDERMRAGTREADRKRSLQLALRRSPPRLDNWALQHLHSI